MTLTSTTGRVVAELSLMKDEISAMQSVYALMPSLIDEEHDAIKASDLDKIEEIAARKLELGGRLDFHVAALKASCQRLAQVAGELGIPTQDRGSHLSASFGLIEAIEVHLLANQENLMVFKHVFAQLRECFENFVAIQKPAQSKVEVNKMVLGKILANRQENYRFWQEVAADLMSGYNAGGKQKASRSGSVLNVKA